MSLSTTTADEVATIVISRPPGNAWDLDVVHGLGTALIDADADPAARVIVIAAEGREFCSGGEIGGPAGEESITAHRRHYVEAFVRLDRILRSIGTPVIARVQGDAKAGGLAVVAACDVAVAADTARFATPEVRGGMFPLLAMGMLRDHLAPKRAFALFYGGEPLSSVEAVQAGLITDAVEQAELDARVGWWCDRLREASPRAVALGRRAYWTMGAEASRSTGLGGEALLELLGDNDAVPDQSYMFAEDGTS